MTVWVAEQGAYSSRCVVGVYATAEAGMQDHPVPTNYPYPSVPSASDLSRPTGWHLDADGSWSNGLDWEAGIDLTPYEVQGLETSS